MSTNRLFEGAPPPATALGVHRTLSPKASVKVSPLCLGGMSFGDAWKNYMGVCDKKTTFEILDYFYERGGNFIDTSNNYQNEESETWIGEWMAQRGNRDEMVIATKYTTPYTAYKGHDGKNSRIHTNSMGNGTKSLHMSVQRSLKKLQTDYIDVLYVHWWDWATSIEEVMQSLNNLVRAGKVLYLAVSDTPAWVVARANQYARDHGLAQFVVYQGLWNAAVRDLERDVIPMATAEGMAIAPWGALGRGMFKTEEQRKQAEHGRSSAEAPPSYQSATKVLETVAKRHGASITSIALAYVIHKTPDVYPIVGGRSIKHLQENIDALLIDLSDDDIKEIDGGYDFEIGFPLNFIGTEPGDMFLAASVGPVAKPNKPKPIHADQVKSKMAKPE